MMKLPQPWLGRNLLFVYQSQTCYFCFTCKLIIEIFFYTMLNVTVNENNNIFNLKTFITKFKIKKKQLIKLLK